MTRSTVPPHQLKAIMDIHKNNTYYFNDGLIDGILGGILLDFSFAKTCNDSFFLARGTHNLNTVIDRLFEQSDGLNGFSLANGLLGLLFVIEVLGRQGLIEDKINIPNQTKKVIYSWAKAGFAEFNTDFLHGPLGAVHYFSFTAKSVADKQRLTKLVSQLLKLRGSQECAPAFFPNISGTDPEERTAVKTGIAHGLCGIFLTLLNVLRLGILDVEIKSTITIGITALLVYCKTDNDEESIFPKTISCDQYAVYTPKLAWCFGDINVIYLLYTAGIMLNNNAWISKAGELADIISAKLCYTKTDALFPSFCHGTAGVARMYDRLYHVSGNKTFLTQKKEWLNRTFDLVEKMNIRILKPSLLGGYIGLGLIYNDIAFPEGLNWSELFLI